VAGAIIDRSDIRRVLVGTTIGRGVVWGLLLPAAWVVFSSGMVVTGSAALSGMYASLLFLSFVDGSMVAFGAPVDIDNGGVDLLCRQNNIEVTDNVRQVRL